MGLRKGVVVLVVKVVVLGSFGLCSGEFLGLTTRHLFLGLFTETGGLGGIWDSPICNRLSRTFNREIKGFYALLAVANGHSKTSREISLIENDYQKLM